MYSPSEDGGSRSEGSSDSKSSLDVPPSSSRSHQQHHHRQTSAASSHEHSHHNPTPDNRHHRTNEAHHVFAHGLGPAIAALRKKRKKFSASRASTPTMTSENASTIESTSMMNPPGQPSAVTVICSIATTKAQLQRASSVPTRVPEIGSQVTVTRRHEVTQSQQPSLDTGEMSSVTERLGETLNCAKISKLLVAAQNEDL